MKIFVDTANINEIREAVKLGIIDGVTTNPSLIAKEARLPDGQGRDPEKALKEIFEIVDGTISVEVIDLTSADSIIKEARKLSKKWGKKAAIKIPITKEGLSATSILSKEGIAVNMTLIFSPNQALLAAKAGAAYVSPFVGRLDDIGNEGMEYIRQMAQIFKTYNFSTQIIAASIRNPIHVIDSALAGAHIATIPFKVIEQMIKHPLTDIGIDKFNKDWEKVKGGK